MRIRNTNRDKDNPCFYRKKEKRKSRGSLSNYDVRLRRGFLWKEALIKYIAYISYIMIEHRNLRRLLVDTGTESFF